MTCAGSPSKRKATRFQMAFPQHDIGAGCGGWSGQGPPTV